MLERALLGEAGCPGGDGARLATTELRGVGGGVCSHVQGAQPRVLGPLGAIGFLYLPGKMDTASAENESARPSPAVCSGWPADTLTSAAW
eukprot:2570438-Alexandrium_andersonii.AAC.1